MEIMNIYAEVVLSQKLFKSKTHIDVSNLPNGIYFIQLKTNPGAIQRFIKSAN
jgi:hypothetical protein